MQYAKPLIVDYFSNAIQTIYSENDISEILRENKKEWRLSTVTTTTDFIKFLVNKKILTPIKISNPKGTTFFKYIFKNASPFEIALSLSKGAYISHYSAMFLHHLTDNIPKKIYINKEQVNRAHTITKQELIQENIDKAFAKSMRITNNIFSFENYQVYLLNGKNVNKLGVIDFDLDGKVIPVTSIERTLIDITVRPSYAGGVQEVLNAFAAAKGRFSVNRLIALLKKMNFTYPYHQAIGFYLEKAGYEPKLIDLVKRIEIKYKFYLTYGMKETDFSQNWQIYVPKGF